MLRPRASTFDLLLDILDTLKKRILLYDESWVPALPKTLEGGNPEGSYDEATLAAIEWLAGQGLIKEPPIEMGAVRD